MATNDLAVFVCKDRVRPLKSQYAVSDLADLLFGVGSGVTFVGPQLADIHHRNAIESHVAAPCG